MGGGDKKFQIFHIKKIRRYSGKVVEELDPQAEGWLAV